MRRKMPSREQIARYWRDHSGREKFRDVHGDDCFACGDTLRLERCHIVPKHKGGTDAVDNLHVLCATCHVHSENIADYWHWFDGKKLDCGINRILSSYSPESIWAIAGKRLLAVGISHEEFLESLRACREARMS